MKAFLRFYRMHQPDVEAKWGSIGFRVLRSDRGGEFVAALALQESKFEAWLREEKIELDLSDAEDHRMNSKAEEMWRWMVPGAEKLLRVSGLTDQFFVDALTCYVITYNQQRTAANRLGSGAPPWESLGLRCFHPERLRTFGSLGWLKRPVGKAGKDLDDRGRVGGLPHRRHMVVHLGYTWTMRGYAVLDIARRMLYVSRKVSVDPITAGTMSFLRQVRENPAMARLQTTPTGMKWVRKVHGGRLDQRGPE